MYKQITFEWEKDIVSWNKIYSPPHWTVRSKLKEKWVKFFEEQFNKHDKIEFCEFQIKIYHNTRIDVDNVALSKFCADFMRKDGWVKDDNKKYYKGYSCFVDETLPKNGIKVVISGYEID
jgi:Holliday junction resolvase RusA-like endonuclease